MNGEVRRLADGRHELVVGSACRRRGAQRPGLQAGDVLGSGTVGGGCILEHGDGRWLRPGDEVELEIEGIGVLRNTVGQP